MCSEKQKSKGAHTHIHIHPKRERKGETRVVTFSPEYIWYIFMAVGAVKTDFCLRFKGMSLSSKFLLCLQVSNPIIFPIQKLGFDSVITTLTISLDSDPQSTLLPPQSSGSVWRGLQSYSGKISNIFQQHNTYHKA